MTVMELGQGEREVQTVFQPLQLEVLSCNQLYEAEHISSVVLFRCH